METKEIRKRMTAVNNGFLHVLLNIALLALAVWLCVESGNETTAFAGIAIGVLWGCGGCIWQASSR